MLSTECSMDDVGPEINFFAFVASWSLGFYILGYLATESQESKGMGDTGKQESCLFLAIGHFSTSIRMGTHRKKAKVYVKL